MSNDHDPLAWRKARGALSGLHPDVPSEDLVWCGRAGVPIEHYRAVRDRLAGAYDQQLAALLEAGRWTIRDLFVHDDGEWVVRLDRVEYQGKHRPWRTVYGEGGGATILAAVTQAIEDAESGKSGA